MENLKAITFDLYGTLVDWRFSIGNAINLIRPGLVDEFFTIEYENISGLKNFEMYSSILKKTLMELLQRHGIEYEDDLGEMLVRMFSKSPFFPDSILGLIKLKKYFKIGIISNTERKLINATLSGMEDLIDYVVTAEETGYYKPGANAFTKALEIMNLKNDEILHVSAYPQYDLKTSKSLGIKSVLLNRYGYSWELEIKRVDEILSIL